MKKASDDLFRLIKSLTKSEKGYIKKFASRNSPGVKRNYITLFDAVDDMNIYDEEELRNKLKEQPFVTQIAVYKVYLFNLILKALQFYGSYENTDTKISDMIAGAKILAKKQMPKEALKILKKAKKIAYKYDNEKALLDILSSERNIIMVSPDKHIIEKRTAIYEEQKHFIERLSNRFYYTWLSDQMVMFVEHKGEVNREQEMDKIMSDHYMQSPDFAIGFSAKIFYYHTHLFYHIARQNLLKFHEATKDELLLLEQHRHLIDENPKNYISGLMNYILSSHLCKKPEDVKDALKKLAAARKQFKGKLFPDVETELFIKAKNIELIVYCDRGDMQRGMKAVSTVESDLKKYKKFLNPSITTPLLYNASYTSFINGDFKKALHFINKLLNEEEILRTDITNFAKVYNLLIHYELEHYDHLEYITENTRRYLKEYKALFKVEELIINAIKNLLGVLDRKEKMHIFEELLHELNKISVDLKSKKIFEFFDAVSWVESKLTGEKFSEIKRRKYKL